MKRKNSNKGFSLVELIVVIAIMGVLIAILAPQFLSYVRKAHIAVDVANAHEIAEAVKLMQADGGSITEARRPGASVVDYIMDGPTTLLNAGYQIHGLDGITEIPVSHIDSNTTWCVCWNDAGEVFVGLVADSGTTGWILYPEYIENYRWFALGYADPLAAYKDYH